MLLFTLILLYTYFLSSPNQRSPVRNGFMKSSTDHIFVKETRKQYHNHFTWMNLLVMCDVYMCVKIFYDESFQRAYRNVFQSIWRLQRQVNYWCLHVTSFRDFNFTTLALWYVFEKLQRYIKIYDVYNKAHSAFVVIANDVVAIMLVCSVSVYCKIHSKCSTSYLFSRFR